MPRYQFASENQSRAEEADGATRQPSLLTRMEREFPHVLAAIQSMWGYPELNLYFSKLTLNERGKREGFPAEVWDDIHLLWQIHLTIIPDSLSTQRFP